MALSSVAFQLQQSIRNQTDVSVTLTTHLLSNKFPNSNVVFSPLSIHVALSLLAVGSEGQTHNNILGFLKANTDDDLNSLYTQLVSLIFADGSPSGGPRLSFVNGIWVEKTLSLKPSFQHVSDTVYKADCNQADFQNNAAEVANEVNAWAEKHTNGLIKKVLEANAIDRLTWLIFANAAYFKGSWSQKFDRSKTKESIFHLLDGNNVQVPFMTSKKKQLVSEYDDFKILGLPYIHGEDERRLTMYFLLPHAKDGLQSLLEKISSQPNFFDRHIPVRKVPVGQFLVPKFKISFDFKVSPMLEELGLELSFKDGLTKMVDSSIGQSPYVSSIHHKSFLEVNEEGTEVAVVTQMIYGAAPPWCKPPVVDFVADHPFLFVIREDVTKVMLFMGQVIDPSVG